MSHQEKNGAALGKEARNRIHQITGIQVQELLAKLQVIIPIVLPDPIELQELIPPPLSSSLSSSSSSIPSSTFLQDFYTPGEYNASSLSSSSTGKHVLQEVSILAHLQRIGALSMEEDDTSKTTSASLSRPMKNDRGEEENYMKDDNTTDPKNVMDLSSSIQTSTTTTTSMQQQSLSSSSSSTPPTVIATTSPLTPRSIMTTTASTTPSHRTVAIELGAGTGRLSDRLQRVTNASMHHILIDRQDFAPQKSRIRHMMARSQQMILCKDRNVVDGLGKDPRVQHNMPPHPPPKSKKRQKKTTTSAAPNNNAYSMDGTTCTSIADQQFQYSTTATTTPTTLSSITTNTNTSQLPTIIERVVTDIATMDLSKYILLSSSRDDFEDENNEPDNAPPMVSQGLLPFSGTDTNNTELRNSTTTIQTTTTPASRRPRQRTICLSKHLCGPACDLAIASLGRVQPRELRPSHVVVATCCHYLCTWDSFAGARFWTTMGLTRQDFEIAVTCSQWASLKQQQDEKGEAYLETTTDVPSQQQHHQQQPSSDTTKPPRQVPFNTSHSGSSSNDPDSQQNMKTQGNNNCRNNNNSNKSTMNQGGSSSFSNLMQRATNAGEALAALQSDPAVSSSSSSSSSSSLMIPSKEFEQCFSRAQKIQLGRQLKQLLDLARIAGLQTMMTEKEGGDGYSHVELVRYTTRSVEDRLLVAYDD
jgi:hypothetical protein